MKRFLLALMLALPFAASAQAYEPLCIPDKYGKTVPMIDGQAIKYGRHESGWWVYWFCQRPDDLRPGLYTQAVKSEGFWCVHGKCMTSGAFGDLLRTLAPGIATDPVKATKSSIATNLTAKSKCEDHPTTSAERKVCLHRRALVQADFDKFPPMRIIDATGAVWSWGTEAKGSEVATLRNGQHFAGGYGNLYFWDAASKTVYLRVGDKLWYRATGNMWEPTTAPTIPPVKTSQAIGVPMYGVIQTSTVAPKKPPMPREGGPVAAGQWVVAPATKAKGVPEGSRPVFPWPWPTGKTPGNGVDSLDRVQAPVGSLCNTTVGRTVGSNAYYGVNSMATQVALCVKSP